MQRLVPYLLGEPHPAGTRLTDYQKCVRTNDIDEVGDNRHLTYFEMLGNWSLGEYFREESIAMSYEFLTKELKDKWEDYEGTSTYHRHYGDGNVCINNFEQSYNVLPS